MCGILGILNTNSFSSDDFLDKLKKIQHRGQEGYGYSYIDQNKISIYKKVGKILKEDIKSFNTNIALGHTRYSTSGKSKTNINYIENNKLISEIQPFLSTHLGKKFSLVHNGNIPNIEEIYRKLGCTFKIDELNSDSEFIVKYIENSEKNLIETLKIFMENVERAFSILILIDNKIYILRDRYGTRPLCIGFNESGWCISSESCVFNNYSFLRDVNPGEILVLDENNIKTLYNYKETKKIDYKKGICLFEYIYFLNENSYADNYQVSQLRYKFGIKLAEQDLETGFNKLSLENTIVVGSPSTGIPSGKGYADRMNYKYTQVLKKNVNIGRTFILENNKKREDSCRKKFYLDVDKIKDKNIILVDDSLVRGTTMRNLIKIFRESGIKSIHIRIAAPPIKYPCFYGIDIPSKNELIANNNDVEKICKIVDADSLSYINLDKIKDIMQQDFDNLCTGCFNNNYNQSLEW